MGDKLELTKIIIELGIAVCTVSASVFASVFAWINSKKTKKDVSVIKGGTPRYV